MPRVLPVVVLTFAAAVIVASLAGNPVVAGEKPAPPATMPVPADYREWVYLTSGMDMTYAAPGAVGLTAEHHSVFDNVFVNPDAYRTFVKTGAWPDDTTFVLENRIAQESVSIDKGGRTQGAEVTGLEIHAKLHGEWAFYVRGKDGNERLVPKPASCYTCHEQHAAVDTTFTQFYPTLLPIATDKHVLSDAYLHDLADHAHAEAK